MAEHYGAAVIPTRVRHPRDKAKVESGVQVVEYWAIAPLRKRQFFSIEEINQALWEKLEELNLKEMRHLGKSRRELFEELDKPALKPLPERVYELAEWKRAKVSLDYHVEYAGHYYSVPYLLIHKNVDIRATENVVEVFYKGKRVASHRREESRGRHSTLVEHMPEAHRRYGEWNPERFIRWAERSGSATAEMPRWSGHFFAPAVILNRAIGPLWAFCGWSHVTARKDWKQPASEPFPSAFTLIRA